MHERFWCGVLVANIEQCGASLQRSQAPPSNSSVRDGWGAAYDGPVEVASVSAHAVETVPFCKPDQASINAPL
jgi:hypothetical protein